VCAVVYFVSCQLLKTTFYNTTKDICLCLFFHFVSIFWCWNTWFTRLPRKGQRSKEKQTKSYQSREI